MALATRPKPTVSHRKRRAEHHRHSRHYLRPYWPYLPMLAIIGAGVIVNKLWAAGLLPGVTSSSASLPSLETTGSLTPIQRLTGSPATPALETVFIITRAPFHLSVFH